MPVELRVHPAKMIAFQIGEIEILQVRAAKGTIGGKIQLLAFWVVDQHAPITIGIDFNNLVGWGHVDPLVSNTLELM